MLIVLVQHVCHPYGVALLYCIAHNDTQQNTAAFAVIGCDVRLFTRSRRALYVTLLQCSASKCGTVRTYE